MPRQFKQARQFNKLKVTEAAGKLGISQPMLSAWEGDHKSPSIDGLEHMADLYGVTTDFLLGRTGQNGLSATAPIPLEALPVFHGKPVWSTEHGWLLVNAIERVLMLPNGQTIPFADSKSLYTLPQLFSEPVLSGYLWRQMADFFSRIAIITKRRRHSVFHCVTALLVSYAS